MCSSSNPGSELFEFLPHVKHLERMADEIVDDAPLESLHAYVDRYRYRDALDVQVPTAALRSLERLPYDPVTYLCAMSRFLGPLLVPLIKLLQLPHKRVMLYSPAPIERAAIIGFNLAEIVHAAYVHAGRAPGDVRVKGHVGLFDLPALKREAEQGVLDHAWIAWTADKVFKDNTDVYDVFVDVSSFPYPDAARHLHCPRPMGLTIAREPAPCTNDLRWSTNDLTLYLELAEQERQYEKILLQNCRPQFDEWRTKIDDGPSCGLRVSLPKCWHYQQQDGRSLPVGYAIVLAASLRVWLAEWWVIRSQLHVAVPISLVFPLGVRGDGGISTGIVDLSDSNMSSDEEDEDAASDDDNASTHGSDTAGRRSMASIADEAGSEAGYVRSLAESLKESARQMPSADHDSDQQSIYSQDDPLIAACGLGVPSADRWRRSSSYSCSNLDPRRVSYTGRSERTFVPAHPRFDPSTASQLPMETMSSVYLFTLWSSYVRAMHIQVSAYLAERVRALPEVEQSESAPLLLHRTVAMSSRDFRALSLDAGNELDRALVQSILTSMGPYRLSLQRSWLS